MFFPLLSHWYLYQWESSGKNICRIYVRINRKWTRNMNRRTTEGQNWHSYPPTYP
jgi:hypothetical protein